MTDRFIIEAKGKIFDRMDSTQIVFHGINKSGSWAMAKVIGEGLAQAGRANEYVCHYGSKFALQEFCTLAYATIGRSFVVGHNLHGVMKPRAHRAWVTQFRHPLTRTVSVHSWLRRKHARTHGNEEGFPSLIDFIKKSNGIARSQISQFSLRESLFRKSRAERLEAKDLYEIAVGTVEREIYAIGIAEKFEESIFIFSKLCGVDSVAQWNSDKRNESRPRAETLSALEREVIEDVYQWDFAFYRYALERFDRQCEGIDFGSSLHAYKEACEGEYKDRLTL